MTKHKPGGEVLALMQLLENGLVICEPGDRGQVELIDDESGHPLVKFYRTGRASLMDADLEVVAVRGGKTRIVA